MVLVVVLSRPLVNPIMLPSCSAPYHTALSPKPVGVLPSKHSCCTCHVLVLMQSVWVTPCFFHAVTTPQLHHTAHRGWDLAYFPWESQHRACCSTLSNELACDAILDLMERHVALMHAHWHAGAWHKAVLRCTALRADVDVHNHTLHWNVFL